MVSHSPSSLLPDSLTTLDSGERLKNPMRDNNFLLRSASFGHSVRMSGTERTHDSVEMGLTLILFGKGQVMTMFPRK